MTPAERAFAQFIQQVKPARMLSTLQRYVLAVAIFVGAEAMEWLVWGVLLGRPPATFVALIYAVLASSRFLGAGPGWLTAALATLGLACDMSRHGESPERFVGTVAAYLAILLFRQGSFGGGSEFRCRGKRPRVREYILLARDRLSALLRLSQNSIEQRRAAEQPTRPISFTDAAW